MVCRINKYTTQHLLLTGNKDLWNFFEKEKSLAKFKRKEKKWRRWLILTN